MADTKISGLPAVTAFATTQEFIVNDLGISKKITGAQITTPFAQGTLAGGYAEVTASQGTFTAETDITGLTVTVTPVSPVVSSRRIRISCMIGASSSVATDSVAVYIKQDTTYLQKGGVYIGATGIGWHQIYVSYVFSNILIGARTYKIAMARDAGSGNITMQAAPTSPSYIHVEDIGV